MQPELRAPASLRLFEVGDAQADVIDPVQLDHQRTRHRQPLDAVEEVRAQPLGRPVELELDPAREQVLERDPDLHLRQVRAEAVVHAAGPEGHVLVRVAADVEAHRLLEDGLVAVARDEPGRDLVAGADLLAGELGVDRGGAAEVVHRGGPAQHLLGRSLAQLVEAGSQALALVGVLAQRDRPWLIVWRVVSLPAVASSTK